MFGVGFQILMATLSKSAASIFVSLFWLPDVIHQVLANNVSSVNQSICSVPFSTTTNLTIQISTNNHDFFDVTLFSLHSPIIITSLIPAFGPSSGGTLITILGEQFVSGTYVHFNGTKFNFFIVS